jgi:hypothetical protein
MAEVQVGADVEVGTDAMSERQARRMSYQDIPKAYRTDAGVPAGLTGERIAKMNLDPKSMDSPNKIRQVYLDRKIPITKDLDEKIKEVASRPDVASRLSGSSMLVKNALHIEMSKAAVHTNERLPKPVTMSKDPEKLDRQLEALSKGGFAIGGKGNDSGQLFDVVERRDGDKAVFRPMIVKEISAFNDKGQAITAKISEPMAQMKHKMVDVPVMDVQEDGSRSPRMGADGKPDVKSVDVYEPAYKVYPVKDNEGKPELDANGKQKFEVATREVKSYGGKEPLFQKTADGKLEPMKREVVKPLEFSDANVAYEAAAKLTVNQELANAVKDLRNYPEYKMSPQLEQSKSAEQAASPEKEETADASVV